MNAQSATSLPPNTLDSDVTPDDLVQRARALRSLLREQQAASEARGHYGEEIHERMLAGGLYRICQPRAFGGYELDVKTFYRVVVEIATGDPGSGWCFALAASHGLMLASHWGERAQREIFGPDGDFRAPHGGGFVPTPARAVDGGYFVAGTFRFSSGSPWSTHLMCNITVDDDKSPEGPIVVIIPRKDYEILDDWGGGRYLGMQASGSNSVHVEGAFVPQHLATPMDWFRYTGPTPGVQLHQNPMYLGMAAGLYHASLVAPVVGAARAALDEFENMMRTRSTLPPAMPRYQHYDYLRTFGLARGLADAAEATLYAGAEQYMENARRWAATGESFGAKQDSRIFGMMQRAGQLASEAVEMLFHHAGTSACKSGDPLLRYFRDTQMYRSHGSAHPLDTASDLARVHFGIPTLMWGDGDD